MVDDMILGLSGLTAKQKFGLFLVLLPIIILLIGLLVDGGWTTVIIFVAWMSVCTCVVYGMHLFLND